MYRIIILILISTASFGQVMQVSNGSRVDQRYITTLGFRLPQVCWVTGNPNLLNYSTYNSKGAMVYDTCAGKIKRWDGSAWVAVADSGAGGGSGITELTGDVTAGPGIGSQAATLATVNANVGSFTNASITVNGKGLITAASSGSSSGAINYIASDSAYVGTNSGVGGTGTDGGANNSKNILVGARVGFSMTTGTDNVSFGEESLYGNTQGSGNFALGRRALVQNTTGSRNIAIGDSAKYGAIGSDNIAIGTNALKTGGTNQIVAIGTKSLELLPSGGGCTNCGWVSIGYLAGSKITTNAFPAVIIGANASGTSTNTARSTVIGSFAAQNATSIADATVIGYNAFPLVTGALSGTQFGIGYNVGASITSGTGVFIGNNSNGAATSAGQMAIGNNVSTAGANQIAIGASVTTSGDRQIAIGSNSGGQLNTQIGWSQSASSGTNNTFIGGGVFGSGSVSGSNNVAVGLSVGSGRTLTGGSNTFLGREAGRNGAAGTLSGDHNIYLGSLVRVLSIAGSNQLIIGGNAVNWITRFAGTTGQYLFNTTTSEVTAATTSAALEVNGTTGAVLLPRLTTTQRNALTGTNGMQVYNSTLATNDVYAAAAWYQQPNGLTGSATLDFASTNAQLSADLTITVTGAAVGDIVMLGTPVQDANATFTGFVSAANTVTVRFNNYSAGAIDPASGTYKVYVIKN